MQLCPWCSSGGPCQYRNGIECTSYICKRDKPNQNDPNDTFVEMFAKMFGNDGVNKDIFKIFKK